MAREIIILACRICGVYEVPLTRDPHQRDMALPLPSSAWRCRKPARLGSLSNASRHEELLTAIERFTQTAQEHLNRRDHPRSDERPGRWARVPALFSRRSARRTTT